MSHATTGPGSPCTTLDEIARTSTGELLAAYGVKTGPGPELGVSWEMPTLGFAGIIGFTGRVLRGTLLIAMTKVTLERSNPVAGSASREWIGELANQLLGRIKNRLLACGVEIHATTPLVLRGEHLSLEALRCGSTLELGTDGGPILVWLETEGDEGLELVRQNQASIIAEGDLLLF